MSGPLAAEKRILAIDPNHRGFGYVVFEGPDRLIDWGVRHIRGEKNKASLRAVSELIDRYRPHILVLEDAGAKGCRKRGRVRELLKALETRAALRGLSVRKVQREKVRRAFLARGIRNKDQVARSIAARFPELAHHVPPERKPWMSEDLRMAMFDAAALAVAFSTRNRRTHTSEGVVEDPQTRIAA
jgi:Holliday junction resolvasome RuvABC endonuclease subunit